MKFSYKKNIWAVSVRVLAIVVMISAIVFAQNVHATGSYVWTLRSGTGAVWRTMATSYDGATFIAGAGQFNSNGSLFLSTNSGVSWSAIAAVGSHKWYGTAVSADGTKMAASSYAGDIYTSTDGGVNWTDRTAAGTRNWLSVAISSDGQKIAAVDNAGAPGAGSSTPGDIYTSTDNGATWTDQTAAGTRNWMSIASSTDGTHLAACVNGGDIYTSTDSGATWTDQTGSGSRSWTKIASSADGSKLVASVSGGQVYTSGDGGVSWTPHISGNIWNIVASSADGTQLAASSNNQIYTSVDSGTTWAAESGAGVRSWGALAIAGNGTKIFGGVFNSGFMTGAFDTAPNSPSSLGPSSKIDGSGTNSNQPTVTFSLTDPDVGDTVKYEIIISMQSNFSSPVIDYTSALAAQGDASFTVGQAAGSGAYTTGTGGQTLVDGSYYWEVKTIDSGAAASSYVVANSGSVAFLVDATAPVLTETSSISSPTANHTPSYTFSSNEAGTISYGGSCVSVTTSAVAGSNTVTFNTLADSAYGACTITVTDALENTSSTLTISPFTVATPSTGARGHVAITESPSAAISTTSMPATEIKQQEKNIEKEISEDIKKEEIIPAFTFTKKLSQGSAHKEVFQLQSYLNTHGFIVALEGAGSAGNETESFGSLTYAALKKFQEAHATEILTPLGLKKGTGKLGGNTIMYINNHP